MFLNGFMNIHATFQKCSKQIQSRMHKIISNYNKGHVETDRLGGKSHILGQQRQFYVHPLYDIIQSPTRQGTVPIHYSPRCYIGINYASNVSLSSIVFIPGISMFTQCIDTSIAES